MVESLTFTFITVTFDTWAGAPVEEEPLSGGKMTVHSEESWFQLWSFHSEAVGNSKGISHHWELAEENFKGFS